MSPIFKLYARQSRPRVLQVEYLQSPKDYAGGNGATFLLHLAPPGQPFDEATPRVNASWLSHPAHGAAGSDVPPPPPPLARPSPPALAGMPPTLPAEPGLFVEIFSQVR